VKHPIKTGLTVIAVIIALVAAFVAGLFIYVNATAKPLHPDPKAVSFVTQPGSPAKWAGAVEKGRQFVHEAVVAQNLPGASVAVGAGDEIVWAEGIGLADLEKRIPVTPATRFRIGGVSIPITSAAAGILIEKGRLNLEADVQRYVPSFPEKQWPVTVRQLMGHMAGIRSDEGDEEPLGERCEKTVDGLNRFAQEPLRFEPGTRFRESSYGWILVSAAIESAAGEPFSAFVRTQVLEPAGMTSTRPDAWQEAIPDRSTFYFPRFGGDPRYGPDPAREGDYSCFTGAGAYLSTPSDLVRFGFAVRGGKLLQPGTTDMLQTSQRLTTEEETGYGLGWSLETVDLAGKPARMAGHGTKNTFIGGTTSLMTFPELGLVVAMTTNTSFADTKSIALKVAQAFAEQGKK